MSKIIRSEYLGESFVVEDLVGDRYIIPKSWWALFESMDMACSQSATIGTPIHDEVVGTWDKLFEQWRF